MTSTKSASSTPATLRAAVYCRISKDRTGEGQGVERQREACLDLARSRGWTVDPAHVYTENDTSATTGKRKHYAAMIAAAESGRFDVIVSWHVDRLTRKLTELEELIALSERSGVTIATVSGDLDLTTDAGRLVGRILASVARGEVERKGARQRAANEQRASQGKPPHTGRAFGYNLDGTPHLTEAEAVRDLFAQFVSGAGTQVLATRLSERGFTNTHGRPWTRTGVRQLLDNPRYIAERWTLRTGRDGRRVREYVGPGAWEALVDEPTFRAAASILTDPARKAAGREGNARKFFGAGTYRCGVCETPMKTAYGSIGKGTGNTIKYRKYQCPSFHVSRRADYIDSYVEQVIAARLCDPKLSGAMHSEHDADLVRSLRDEASGLRARSDSLAADLADGLLTARQVKVASDRIGARLSDVESQLAELGSQTALGQVLTAADPGAAWLALDDVNQRAAVVDALAEVRLMPAPRGRRPSDNNPEKVAAFAAMIASTVVIDWR